MKTNQRTRLRLTPFYVGLLLTALSMSSCKKTSSDVAVHPEETLLTTLADKASEVNSVSATQSTAYEMGTTFSASVAGKLTKLGSRMPEPGSYRIIIWDYDTKALLRQKTVEQSSPNQLALTDIDALPVTANKKYVISINNYSGGVNKKYWYIKNSSSEFLPLSKGNVLIHNACYGTSGNAAFPGAGTSKTSAYGYPDFVFVAD